MSDETPPTGEPEKETAPPPEPPKETPPVPPKESEIPEWGKSLIGQVNELASRVKDPTEIDPEDEEVIPAPDKSPVREPWHKRGWFS